ncbi:MAG: class I SAM-dependent methyltransferase [Deltaproteobacteria bacterium]|nr:class I SAM-dependent methyltransferase [Deltaproteobacteria bacterium]
MNCPLCRSPEAHLFHKFYSFILLECNSCKLKFQANPYLTAQPANNQTEPESQILPNLNLPHIKRRIEDIIRYASSGYTLDIGCNTGEVAVRLSHLGFSSSGIDINKTIMNRLRSTYPGVRWYSGLIEDLISNIGKYDVITLYHVLEHIAEPVELLKRIDKALNPKGILIIEVPNVSGLHARIKGTGWHYYHRDHLCYYSPEHLDLMANKLGYEILDKKSFYHLSYPQGVFWKDTLKNFLSSIGFKDIISIFLRKK